MGGLQRQKDSRKRQTSPSSMGLCSERRGGEGSEAETNAAVTVVAEVVVKETDWKGIWVTPTTPCLRRLYVVGV